MGQLGQVPQRIQVRQLSHIIRRQNKCRQTRQRRSQRGLNMLDPVAREEEGMEARKEGEVREGRNIVIGEVDRILVLYTTVSKLQDSCFRGKHPPTLAIPRFSIAGILCPTRRTQNDINPAHFKV